MRAVYRCPGCGLEIPAAQVEKSKLATRGNHRTLPPVGRVNIRPRTVICEADDYEMLRVEE